MDHDVPEFPRRLPVGHCSIPPRGLTSCGRMLRCGLEILLVCFLCNTTARAGELLREVYYGIPGSTLGDLTNNTAYPDHPGLTNFLTDLFEAPSNFDDNYGERIHGYLLPPVTGLYTFWIAADDVGALFLSNDQDPARAQLVASCTNAASPRAWDVSPSQQSAPIALTAGQPCYVLALHKEGDGPDNLAVRWLRPDGIDEGPIPAAYLAPFGTVFTSPIVIQQPADITVTEGQDAIFHATVQNADPVSFQWLKNSTPISGAVGPALTLPAVSLSDSGAIISAIVTNFLGSTNTGSAKLTVTPDTTPPALAAASSSSITNVVIVFSEPVAPVSALAKANYHLNNGANIVSVAAGSDTRTLILTTDPLQYGVIYTLTVSGIQDRAATPNTILPQSQISFVGSELSVQDVGGKGGSIQRVGTGQFDIRASGNDIGGKGDQFQYAWERRTGNFDLQVKIPAVSVEDLFVHAGLMARGTLDTNAAFAGVFAASAQLGCFFESRATAGSAAASASLPGGYPANYPQMWLRLSRVGNLFTGYASIDGKNWTELSSATVALPAAAYVGIALCGGNATAVSSAQFRDYGNTTSPTLVGFTPSHEPLGPSSRRTGMVFSEIMYHPRPPLGVTNNLEYVELYNADSIFIDLSGWQLSGGIQFIFPAGSRLAAGNFIVIAADPAAISRIYGITNVAGPFSGALNNSGDALLLIDNRGAIRLDMTYSSDPPWPSAADGTGHSLTLTKPSYGENDPRAWGISEAIGGSPGQLDALQPNPQSSVVINEFLAHANAPQLNYIELYNHNTTAVDLSGCYVTDSPNTNRFRFPSETTVPAHGFVVLNEAQLGFPLSGAGETVYLVNSNATRVIDCVRFQGQEHGVASGRWPDGASSIRRLDHPTPGTNNSPWKIEDIVINEIMYSPISGDKDGEYIELYNGGTKTADLSGWKLRGGVSFKFPAQTSLAPGAYLVVGHNVSHLIASYSQLNARNTLGNFSGSFSGSGDSIELVKPDDLVSAVSPGIITTNKIDVIISQIAFLGGDPWPRMAAGGGSSLELVDARADPLQPMNWAASDETAKAPWTTVETTGRVDNAMSGLNPNRLFIIEQAEGEALVDNIHVTLKGNANEMAINGNFELGSGAAANNWSFFGNHSFTAVETGSGTNTTRILHLRAQGKGDESNNSIRGQLSLIGASPGIATIRADVRWLSGSPEMLFRFRANGLEMPVRFQIPPNLGTPGLPNSRRTANQGPAIYEVAHAPALPPDGAPVTVTCRVSDPDGIESVSLIYRVDPSTNTSNLAMRDDGLGGDLIAKDGIFTATIPGMVARTIAGFHISARDAASSPAASSFPPAGLLPAGLPELECYIRWGDTIPGGTIAHYHLWNSRATDSQRKNSLNNTYRDATLVYGTSRIVYNAGFRDKGSPFHSGAGSYAETNPEGEPLLGETDRVFRSTGNGGSEATALRNQVSAWIGAQMGVPYLHSHYALVYRNGTQQYNVSQDEEAPSAGYAKYWFPSAQEGDLYKIAVWFEFQDNNVSFNTVDATLGIFKTDNSIFKTARYRWNWQTRGYGGTFNDYTSIFNLATVANDTSINYIPNLLESVDVDEWLNVLAYNRVIGNWDSYGYTSSGQNMYAYKVPSQPWRLMPWDIDFTLGEGDPASGPLINSADQALARMESTPQFRRSLLRAFQNALAGALQITNYTPVINARQSYLAKNGIPGLAAPSSVFTYLAARKTSIQNQIAAIDKAPFALSGGSNVLSPGPTLALSGTAPVAAAYITVNDNPYPVTWTGVGSFIINVPLAQGANVLTVAAYDQYGNPLPGGVRKLTAVYAGTPPLPQDNLVINEIHYHPAEPNASFVELYNRSQTTAFDLSNWRLEGIAYTFPAGTVIPAGGYLVLVNNLNDFTLAYGPSIPIAGEFSGSLSNGGESLRLVQPNAGPGGTNDVIVSDVRYDNHLPWPAAADGNGPSLQLIDPAAGSYRVGNWAVTATNSANRVTPGKANANVAQTLAPFPSVWINEVLAENLAGPADNFGEREPFIELYNSGTNAVDLSACYLSSNYTNLAQWPFPAGTTLGGGQFLTVWADGQPSQGTLGSIHTSFRLTPNTGSVAMSRWQGSPPSLAVIDYLDYKHLPPGKSYGDYPDGEPRHRSIMFYPTLGTNNNPASPAIRITINELMAANSATLIDPATGKNDDWFELYNRGTNAADLAAYTLTDDFSNPGQFQIPAGYTLEPGAFLLVWADKTSKSNSPASPDLHVNFKLNKAGKQIGLFDLSGALVDGVTFGPQTNDISYGRYPDGAAAPLEFMTSASPARRNIRTGANVPPQIDAIAEQSVAAGQLLSFQIPASDSFVPDGSLRFTLEDDAPDGTDLDTVSGLFRWTPSPSQQGSYAVYFEVTDEGSPAAISEGHLIVDVGPPASAPELAATILVDGRIRLNWQDVSGTKYLLQYKDALDQSLWQNLSSTTGTGAGQSVIDSGAPASNARYYRLVVNP